MIAQNILEELIAEQFNNFHRKNKGIKRLIDFDYLLKSHLIAVISGIRRSGKSTLMRQIAQNYKHYYYVNFDDERLSDFELDDFRVLMILLQKKKQAKVIFLDEIQLVSGWEKFVRRLFEENYKIFITGSNSKLLSSELATHLVGRYQKIELYPFSFAEYLSFRKINYEQLSSATQAKLLSCTDTYLNNGGFPEFLILNDNEYLKQVYNDVIYRDLVIRFNIKHHKTFKLLSKYLFSNTAKETSYNNLKKLFNIGNTSTVSEYVNYLEQAYLCFELYKFDFSMKKQIIYNKKIFVIDNGLRNIIAFRNSSDTGRLLENMIFIELKRRKKEVFFYKTKENYEVDFLIHENPLQLIQVTYSMYDTETAKREKRALFSAMKELDVKQSLIISYNEYDTIKQKDFTIEVIPVWRWLLAI